MSQSPEAGATQPPPSVNAQAGRGLLVAIVVTGINLAVYGLARLLDVPMELPEPDDGQITRLPIGAVVAASVTSVAMGTLALGLLRQFVRDRAISTFGVLVAVFVLFSLSAPLTTDATPATKVALALMHLLTAAVTFVGLTRPFRSRRTELAPPSPTDGSSSLGDPEAAPSD